MSTTRVADHPVLPLILDRWSPRSFTGETIPDEVLFSLFEAARWAPSAYNSQPWRFIWARNNTPEWNPIFSTLVEFNQLWGKNASAILVIASKEGFRRKPDEDEQKSSSHEFDTGAAWAQLALQAHALGWATHACGGFDKEAVRKNLGLPDDVHPHAIVLVGKPDSADALPENLRAIEVTRGRDPLSAIAFHGKL